MALPDPGIFGVFGYGTAALVYGAHLTFGFPKAKTEEEDKKITKGLSAIGFAFGGIAQFVAGVLLFTLHPGTLPVATTACVFGMLWTAIWLTEYFNADTRPLAFLDVAIGLYTLFAGLWFYHLGLMLLAIFMWSILVLNVLLLPLHIGGKGKVLAGVVALENCVISYYICYHLAILTLH